MIILQFIPPESPDGADPMPPGRGTAKPLSKNDTRPRRLARAGDTLGVKFAVFCRMTLRKSICSANLPPAVKNFQRFFIHRRHVSLVPSIRPMQPLAFHLLNAPAKRFCQTGVNVHHQLDFTPGEPFYFRLQRFVQSLESIFHASSLPGVVGHPLSIVGSTECL